MVDLKSNFNFSYADVPVLVKTNTNEKIINIDDKPYLEWHDLIDIRVPLYKKPELLLGYRVPLPLWGVNPRSILTQIDKDWWTRTRRRVYETSNNYCIACGCHKNQQIGYPKNIDAHEVYDIDWKTGRVTLKEIVPLCSSGCHQYIHFGRLFAQHDAGKIQDKTFYSILSHGNTVLEKAGLPKKNLDPDVDDNIYGLQWGDFHLDLTIEGKEQSFYSLYKDQADLEAHY